MRAAIYRTTPYVLLFAASMGGELLWLRWQESGRSPAPMVADLAHGVPVAIMPSAALKQPAASEEVRIDALAERGLNSEDPDDILEAIRGMRSVYTPESLQALTTLAYGNADRRVREAAVTALQVLGESTGDPAHHIRDALRSLNAGVDTEIAERAQDIAAELDSRD